MAVAVHSDEVALVLAVASSELIHAAIARPSPSTNCSQRWIVALLRK